MKPTNYYREVVLDKGFVFLKKKKFILFGVAFSYRTISGIVFLLIVCRIIILHAKCKIYRVLRLFSSRNDALFIFCFIGVVTYYV